MKHDLARPPDPLAIPHAEKLRAGRLHRNQAVRRLRSSVGDKVMPQIYHGTPMTPAAARRSVLAGRGACVSYFRPDDLEDVLALCPHVMFRPWGLFILDGGAAARRRMVRTGQERVVGEILSVARADYIPSGSMGDNARQSSSPVPAQRRTFERLAIRDEGRSCLAYGRPDRATYAPMRPSPSRLFGMGRRPEAGAGRLCGLPPADGRCG